MAGCGQRSVEAVKELVDRVHDAVRRLAFRLYTVSVVQSGLNLQQSYRFRSIIHKLGSQAHLRLTGYSACPPARV